MVLICTWCKFKFKKKYFLGSKIFSDWWLTQWTSANLTLSDSILNDNDGKFSVAFNPVAYVYIFSKKNLIYAGNI